jgi:hypothetical protein
VRVRGWGCGSLIKRAADQGYERPPHIINRQTAKEIVSTINKNRPGRKKAVTAVREAKYAGESKAQHHHHDTLAVTEREATKQSAKEEEEHL